VGADAIEEEADDDPAPRRLDECADEPQAGLVPVPDVELEVDVVLRLADPLLQGGVEVGRIAQDAQAAGRGHGKAVDPGDQLEELPVPPGQALQVGGRGRIGRAGLRTVVGLAGRVERAAPEPAPLQPVGSDREINQAADDRHEDDGPEPGQGG
jgi:hypothetical protein